MTPSPNDSHGGGGGGGDDGYPAEDSLISRTSAIDVAGGGGGDSNDDTMDTTLTLFHDVEFEERIRRFTKLRREKQETTLSELQVKVSRLEAALAAESKRRVAAVQQLEQKMKQEMQDMEGRLCQQLHDIHVHDDERMNLVEQRIAQLEQRWEHDTAEIRNDITGQSNTLRQTLEELENNLQKERIAQEQRQKELLLQIQQVSNSYEQKWSKERQERLSDVHELQDRLNAQDVVRDEHLRRFEKVIQDEIALLERELRDETLDRQKQDEYIVAGLNRYIQQVQKSLSYVSGV